MAEEFTTERGVSAMGDGSSGFGNSSDAFGAAREAQTLGDRARDAKQDVLDRAIEKKDELKQRATGAIDDQRSTAAGRVNAISQALSGAADSLRDSGESRLSDWVREAAGQVDRVVGYLEGKPTDGMVHDLEDLARRNPALFMGGTYAAGLALGRFLRASAPQPRPGSETGPEYGAPRDTSELGWSGSGLADSGRNPTGSAWTGSAVGSSVGGTDGAAAMGDGEPGLTDEDMRAAWHGSEEPREATRKFDVGAAHSDALDTGELTSYTNGAHQPLDSALNEADRARDSGYGDADRGRGV